MKHNLTILTEEQMWGDYPQKQLEVIKKYGTKTALTDLAIMTGGYVEDHIFLSKTQNLNERTGFMWTKSILKNKNFGMIRVANCHGNKDDCPPKANYIAIRPILEQPSNFDEICKNKKLIGNGLYEVEYGEYPQYVVDSIGQIALKGLFFDNQLKKTGRSFTFNKDSQMQINLPFIPMTYDEYEYDGRKYIRAAADIYDNIASMLSNCESCHYGEYFWIEVSPVKWLVDTNTKTLVSKYGLVSGIKFFDNLKSNSNTFYTSEINEYLDKYMSRDLFQSVSLSHSISLSEEEQKKRNPYGLDFDRVSEEDIIRGAIESGVAVFLHGKSSDGKSARIKQIDPDCEIIYLRNATPESLNGKSVYNSETGEMIDVKPTWLKKLEARCEKEPDKYHIVFLDEITNALPSIQGIAFNIVLDKEVNGIWKLPENARIVAAGNEMKDSLAANQLAEPLFNRFAHVYIETTVESWLKWASENNIHPAIYAYIAYKKDSVLRTEYNGETPNADPRKWEMASKMLYSTKNPEMLRALVGEEITREFVSFCNQRIITLEDVLTGNYSESDLEMNTSEKYATAIGLSQVDMENFETVREFVLQLGEEICATFESLWAHGEEERLEKIAELRMVSGGKIR